MIDPTKTVTGDLIPDAAEWQDTEANLQLASQWQLRRLRSSLELQHLSQLAKRTFPAS